MTITCARAAFFLEIVAGEDWSQAVDQLADSAGASEDLEAFLDGMAGLGATVTSRSTGTRVECAVTLGRRKRPTTIGGSSDQAMLLAGIDQELEQGPGIDAWESGRSILLDDAGASPQWGDHCGAMNAAGLRSALAVPLELDQDCKAVLNFFASAPGAFTRQAVADALAFAAVAGKALRVSIRITALGESVGDLEAALRSRSMIDTACGVIIFQNRCTHDEAFAILRKASNDRNQKLRDLARNLLDGMGTKDHRQARN